MKTLDDRKQEEQFLRLLDATIELLSDDKTPAVRALVRTIRSRYEVLRDQGREGLNAEYLVTDLVGILSHFEMRLRALEQGTELRPTGRQVPPLAD